MRKTINFWRKWEFKKKNTQSDEKELEKNWVEGKKGQNNRTELRKEPIDRQIWTSLSTEINLMGPGLKEVLNPNFRPFSFQLRKN